MTTEMKQEFFRLLDRGSTVRAASKAVGVSADVGYRWCKRAGVPAPRGRPRIYSDDEKAAFFVLLAETGNIATSARQLGFTMVTCAQWAHKAGIYTTKNITAKRDHYLRLRGS